MRPLTAFPPCSNKIKLKTGLDKTEVITAAAFCLLTLFLFHFSADKQEEKANADRIRFQQRQKQTLSASVHNNAWQVLLMLVSIQYHVPSKYRAGIADTDTSDL